jgi:hypothetical protein
MNTGNVSSGENLNSTNVAGIIAHIIVSHSSWESMVTGCINTGNIYSNTANAQSTASGIIAHVVSSAQPGPSVRVQNNRSAGKAIDAAAGKANRIWSQKEITDTANTKFSGNIANPNTLVNGKKITVGTASSKNGKNASCGEGYKLNGYLYCSANSMSDLYEDEVSLTNVIASIAMTQTSIGHLLNVEGDALDRFIVHDETNADILDTDNLILADIIDSTARSEEDMAFMVGDSLAQLNYMPAVAPISILNGVYPTGLPLTDGTFTLKGNGVDKTISPDPSGYLFFGTLEPGTYALTADDTPANGFAAMGTTYTVVLTSKGKVKITDESGNAVTYLGNTRIGSCGQ